MKTRQVVVLGACALALGLSGSLAWAEGEVNEMVAKVPFAFTVERSQLPAGRYEFLLKGERPTVVEVRNEASHAEAFTPVLRRYDNHHIHAEAIFDNVGGKQYLSQVRVPGLEGLEVRGASSEQTTVRGSWTQWQ
jgi:hypothetical protein